METEAKRLGAMWHDQVAEIDIAPVWHEDLVRSTEKPAFRIGHPYEHRGSPTGAKRERSNATRFQVENGGIYAWDVAAKDWSTAICQ